MYPFILIFWEFSFPVLITLSRAIPFMTETKLFSKGSSVFVSSANLLLYQIISPVEFNIVIGKIKLSTLFLIFPWKSLYNLSILFSSFFSSF